MRWELFSLLNARTTQDLANQDPVITRNWSLRYGLHQQASCLSLSSVIHPLAQYFILLSSFHLGPHCLLICGCMKNLIRLWHSLNDRGIWNSFPKRPELSSWGN